MLNEKQSGKAAWVASLNELDSLPGDTQNFDATWDKLDKKLCAPKKNNSAYWYKVAAAAIIVFSIIILNNQNNKKEKAPGPIVKNEQPVIKKQEAQQSFITSNKQDRTIAHNDKKNKGLSPAKKTIFTPQLKIFFKERNDTIKLIAQNADSFLQVKQKPVVFNILRKKLPVIHINDIEKPVAPVEAVAGNNDRAPLRIRIFNRDITTSFTPVTTDNNVFKIKLPPQN